MKVCGISRVGFAVLPWSGDAYYCWVMQNSGACVTARYVNSWFVRGRTRDLGDIFDTPVFGF